jgi:hypothetical protein
MYKLASLTVEFYFCIHNRFIIKNTNKADILLRPPQAFEGNVVIIGINILGESSNKGQRVNMARMRISGGGLAATVSA